MEIETPEREPKLGWRTLALTDAMVLAHLDEKLADNSSSFCGKVMLDEKSRHGRGRRHLKLHKDSNGYFVRIGGRGSCKQYLGRCKITYIDGEAILFCFTLASYDAFEAEQSRRFDEKYGLT